MNLFEIADQYKCSEFGVVVTQPVAFFVHLDGGVLAWYGYLIESDVTSLTATLKAIQKNLKYQFYGISVPAMDQIELCAALSFTI